MKKLGYPEVAFNKPYEGGFIVRWFSFLHSDLFIFSMEVAKNLYMNKTRTKSFPTKVKKIGDDLIEMLNINEEGDFFMDLSTSIVEERAKYVEEHN